MHFTDDAIILSALADSAAIRSVTQGPWSAAGSTGTPIFPALIVSARAETRPLLVTNCLKSLDAGFGG